MTTTCRRAEVVVVVVLALVGVCVFAALSRPVDSEVYRLGGRTWLAGLDLYSPSFPAPFDGPALPFTYPPIAAVLSAPLALLPVPVVTGVVTAVGVGCLAAVLAVAWRTTGRPALTPVRLGGLVLLACLALEPVRSTLAFGQVNLLLMGLVVVDCLVLPARWRGVLVGVAASIKLVPLGFLLLFLARRDRGACARCLGTFAAMAGLACALAPADSWAYWTTVLLDPARIGNPAWITNQSVAGALARGSASGRGSLLVWAAVAAVLAVLTWYGARYLVDRGHDLAALVLVAVWCLLASPVSWSHHWVWVVPGLVALADPRLGPARWRAVAAGGVAVVAGAVPWTWVPFMTNAHLSWPPGQLVAVDAFTWAGLGVVLGTAARARRATGSAHEAGALVQAGGERVQGR